MSGSWHRSLVTLQSDSQHKELETKHDYVFNVFSSFHSGNMSWLSGSYHGANCYLMVYKSGDVTLYRI